MRHPNLMQVTSVERVRMLLDFINPLVRDVDGIDEDPADEVCWCCRGRDRVGSGSGSGSGSGRRTATWAAACVCRHTMRASGLLFPMLASKCHGSRSSNGHSRPIMAASSRVQATCVEVISYIATRPCTCVSVLVMAAPSRLRKTRVRVNQWRDCWHSQMPMPAARLWLRQRHALVDTRSPPCESCAAVTSCVLQDDTVIGIIVQCLWARN